MVSELNPESFAALVAELHAQPSVVETAEQVVEYACAELDAEHAGITLIRRGGRLETISPTDPLVEELDQLQYDLQQGCCVESAWQSHTMHSEALATDPRWPDWGPKAASLGVSSVLSVELNSDEKRRVGALNLYWSQTREFTDDDFAFAQIFGRHAALALSASITNANLHVALDSRKRIGMAQGILMERYGLGTEQAFHVLRRFSQDQNRKLRDVADELIETRQLPAYAVDPVSTDRRHLDPR